MNPLIFRASRYVLWGEIKNLVFEDKKEIFSRNDFSTAKSCKEVCKHHGTPRVVISDRGPQFIAVFT
jgi:hypothetical protein